MKKQRKKLHVERRELWEATRGSQPTTRNPQPVFIAPDWAAASGVRAISTTRTGGYSKGVYRGFNLGEHAGDDPAAVARNRALLSAYLPADPCWLRQVHGNRVIHLADWYPGVEADAAWTDTPGQVAAVLTADCVPVVLAQAAAGLVAVAHAGWRGLAADILPATVAAVPPASGELVAWIGPCIGASVYQVGPEIPEAFVHKNPEYSEYFTPTGEGKFLADLPALARRQLNDAGVKRISGGDLCTASDPARFYSHRRDGITGRMATLAWIDP